MWNPFAREDASGRRWRVGAPRELAEELEGRLVTLVGECLAPEEVLAESHLRGEVLVHMRRCTSTVRLRERSGAVVLLEGALAVAVGTREGRVMLDGATVEVRRLLNGDRVRARGILRRLARRERTGYRAEALEWGLCATGTREAIDVASERRPLVLGR